MDSIENMAGADDHGWRARGITVAVAAGSLVEAGKDGHCRRQPAIFAVTDPIALVLRRILRHD